MAIPKVLRGYNMFVDGRNYAGRVDAVTLPKLTTTTEDWRGGGMDTAIKMDMGLEPMEMGIGFKEHDPALFRLFGLINGNAVAATFRAAQQDDRGNVPDPYIITTRGLFTEINPNEAKAGEGGMLNATLSLRYYRLEIAGNVLVEIDAENMVRNIGGTDVLADHRRILGIG